MYPLIEAQGWPKSIHKYIKILFYYLLFVYDIQYIRHITVRQYVNVVTTEQND